MFAWAVISMVQRLIGGAAADMMAKKKMKTVLFFLLIPRDSRTVSTIPPRTKIDTLPAPVRAPGMSMRIPMMLIRSHLLWIFSTIPLVIVEMAPE